MYIEHKMRNFAQYIKHNDMDKRVIKAVIQDKQREIGKIDIIERPTRFEDAANYVVVGIRRAGKSYQLYQDIKERVSSGRMALEDCLFINIEDERIASIQAEELGIILECYGELFGNRKPYVYLDEIQNIDGWEKFARRLADSHYRVMISGSNAKMLSREIATTLGGRFIIREVYPFSFREALMWHGVETGENWTYDTTLRVSVRHQFETYFHFGGFAETFPLVDKREWINSLYLKILTGDIVARNRIRNASSLRLLAKKMAESVMQPSSQVRLLHIINSSGNKISRNTLVEYLGFMNDAYLTFNVGNFVSSLAERATECKRYFYDNGILNNFLYAGETQLLENLVAIQLVKRYRRDEQDAVYYYRKGVEVDFYVPDESLAIQVSYSIDNPDTRKRELDALVSLANTFSVRKALVITMDEEDELLWNGTSIQVIPAWKWLLME